MSTITTQKNTADCTDANLVVASLGGSRDAFCQIVSRYQNLLCSLAYSAIGDIKHSEDIAQEVFVEAWRKLDTLHEPAKIKAWLCGMLRYKTSHFRRKEVNQPIKNADDIHDHELHDSDQIEQQTINAQHHELLWKVLDEIDHKYREPLVLFYREQQSVERVAIELDLTQDTVKQRLSRGRKLLKSVLSELIETTLEDSKPGVAFTTAVMTVIGSIAPPAKATLLGAGIAKTGSAFKAGTILTFLAMFSGIVSSFFGLRSSLDLSRTKRERMFAIKTVILFMSFALIFVVGMLALKYYAVANSDVAQTLSVVSQLLVIAFAVSYFIIVTKMFKAMKLLREQERIFQPDAFQHESDHPKAKQREYKSKFSFFGVPLVHIRFGVQEAGDKPTLGWISGGSYAHGLLFAWGGVAIAPISVGIISIGLFSIGAVGIGVMGIGTVAIGLIGFGASSIAIKAYGGMSALGWQSAFSNGFSIAKNAAIGPVSLAEHTNNDTAAELVNLPILADYYYGILAIITVLVIVPSVWHSNKVRQRMKTKLNN